MRPGLIRLVIAVLLTVSCGVYAYHRVAVTRARYQIKPGPAVTEKGPLRAIEEMSKQNDLFLNWAVLLLAGSLGLLVTKEPLRIRGVQWAYVLFAGPPAALLLGSSWSGWLFKVRLTYLLANSLEDWRSLTDLLSVQARLFLWALVVLSLLGAWIVIERVSRAPA